MKIALLTDGIHPYVIGGMQKHSLQLVKYFTQCKHTVYLFHCNESSYDINKLEFFTTEEKQYIQSFVIPFPHKQYFPFHYIVESRLYSGLIYKSLKKVLAEIDFIYAQGFCAWELIRLERSRKKPPVAIHFHGLEMFQENSGIKSNIAKYFLRDAVRYNIRWADYCISYGGKITQLLSKITSKDKIWEIPGGVENSWFHENTHITANPVKFVFVGRYERRKGIKEFNEAVISILPLGGFTVDIIGPVPVEYQIDSPLIKYHGQLPSESDILQILSRADVLVCPSYAEGMPNVIMEAMASGLAIIATNVGAISLLVNKDNGWLINFPDPKEISKIMSSIIGDKSGMLALKKSNSYQKMKNYTVDKVNNRLMGHIEESMKKVSLL